MSDLIAQLGPYAKDLVINYKRIIEAPEHTGLTDEQISGIALACGYATGNGELTRWIQAQQAAGLSAPMVFAARAAASIMAMNNVYYRAMHALPDSSYLQMPPGLRMTVMTKPGIDKTDFEYLSLAVSAINGCGLCIGSHTAHLAASGAEKTAIQHALKIAAIVHGIAQAITISTV